MVMPTLIPFSIKTDSGTLVAIDDVERGFVVDANVQVAMADYGQRCNIFDIIVRLNYASS